MSADISMYVGDSRPITVTVTDQNSTIVDLTGASIKWVLVHNHATVRVKDNGSAGGITVTSPTGGQFKITITSNDTQIAGTYTHECRVTDSSNNSSIIFSASFTIQDSNV